MNAAPRAWAVVAASLVISLCFLAVLPQPFARDDGSDFVVHYEPAARHLLAGRGVLDVSGRAELTYPPGFPVVLAATFWLARLTGLSELATMAAANVVGMAASTLLVFLIARRVWDSSSACMSSMAWATYPLALYLVGAPSSEIPFIVLILCALYLVTDAVLRRGLPVWRALVCGLLVGAAMLVRPIGIGLGVVLAFGLVLDVGLARSGRRLVLAGALLLGNVLAIAPWETWAYLRTGSVIALSTQNPAPIRDGLTFAVRDKGFRKGTWVPDDVRDVMQHISDRYPELTTTGAVANVLAGQIAEHPLAVAKLFALKAARSWYGTDSQRAEGRVALIQGLYLVLIGVATFKAWQLGGIARRTAAAAWMIAAYFWAMTLVVLPIARYMVPAMSVLFLILPVWLCDRSRQKDEPA
jgi:4-amino-4-deoxy-L-arabinose transferase-like glycosyltransferase